MNYRPLIAGLSFYFFFFILVFLTSNSIKSALGIAFYFIFIAFIFGYFFVSNSHFLLKIISSVLFILSLFFFIFNDFFLSYIQRGNYTLISWEFWVILNDFLPVSQAVLASLFSFSSFVYLTFRSLSFFEQKSFMWISDIIMAFLVFLLAMFPSLEGYGYGLLLILPISFFIQFCYLFCWLFISWKKFPSSSYFYTLLVFSLILVLFPILFLVYSLFTGSYFGH